MVDRSPAVRCASIKCLCEMIKHSTFLYSSPASLTVSTNPTQIAQISHELDSNVKLAFKSLDATLSNYDVRCMVGTYLAQLIFYSINQLQMQQLQLQQQLQMANAAVMASSANASSSNLASSASGVDASEKQQRQQALQQQQNATAQQLMNEKIKNTIQLLANGFFKLNTSPSRASFNYMRGAASTLAASANSVVIGSASTSPNPTSHSANNNNINQSDDMISSPSKEASLQANSQTNSLSSSGKKAVINMTNSSANSSGGSVINRETRIGATYAYVELANLLGPEWLERNLKLYLTHVLNLVNNTKAVSNHLDAG